MANKTVESYDQNASNYSAEANARGARVAYVDLIFSYINKAEPVVVEIGCGNGRDAKSFLERTQNYTAYDGSRKLVEIAAENNPRGKFAVATFDEIILPDRFDCLVAFASLIHASPKTLARIFEQTSTKLNWDGIFFLDVQAGEDEEEVRVDNMGERTFYRYSPQTLLQLIPKNMGVLYKKELLIRDKKWFELIIGKTRE